MPGPSFGGFLSYLSSFGQLSRTAADVGSDEGGEFAADESEVRERPDWARENARTLDSRRTVNSSVETANNSVERSDP